MIDSVKASWKKSCHRKWFILGAAGIVIVLIVGMVTGGVVWHQKPSFCATCHTPMKSYVDGYKSGNKSLMITMHATGKTALVCLDCHKPTIKEQLTEASRWITGNYDFPLNHQAFGTRRFCLSPGCHVEADIIKATKDYGGAVSYNQHDPRHGKLECYRCHSMHGQSSFMCNQCHNLKLPDGWVSPSVNGVVTTSKANAH
jgi:hypothetical protein